MPCCRSCCPSGTARRRAWHIGNVDRDPTHFAVLDRPWIGCIWELPPFGHERSAWVRHLLDTDRPDLDGYLADMYPDGPAGPAN